MSLVRQVGAELDRLARPGTLVVLVVMVWAAVAGARGVASVEAGTPSPAVTQARYCASQPIEPVSCQRRAAAAVAPAVLEARRYLTGPGRLVLVLRQLASTAGLVGFAALAAVVAASEWSERTVTLRRQLQPRARWAISTSLAALVVVVVAATVAGWLGALAMGGWGVRIWHGAAVVGPASVVSTAARAALCLALFVVFGSLVGALVRNPLGSVAAVLALFLMGTMSQLAASPLDPVHAVAVIMQFDRVDQLGADRSWPVSVGHGYAAGPTLVVAVLVLVAAGTALAALWRRRVLV